MPPIFKALVSITVWVLFALGCLALVGAIACLVMRVSGPAAVLHPCIGIASLFLSSVAAWLRKALE